MQQILEIKNINKSFGGVVAASNINIKLHEGEILGLIGPNGAGKTTLLNLISGLIKCDKGEILFNGKNITKYPSFRRARMGLSRTFQQPRLMQRASIRDNLLVGNDLADRIGYLKSFIGIKATFFDTELTTYLKLAGLEIGWNDNISSLPYGKRKLLEIIRALLSHPKVILIDEPAAGLNDVENSHVNEMIMYMVKKGIAVILIEHKMDMIMSICHKIVVLNFGEVIAYGSPEEISNNEKVLEAYLGRKHNCVEN